MIATLVLLVVGLLVLVLQGALTTFLPAALCPDFVLLIVIGLALHVGGARALLVAALLGYAGDLLSGAPLGEHALLRVLAFGAARAANRSLELRTPIAQATLAGVLTLLQGVVLVGLAWLLEGRIPVDARTLAWLGAQTVLNAAFAPGVGMVVDAIASRAGEEEAPRRPVALGNGRRAP